MNNPAAKSDTAFRKVQRYELPDTVLSIPDDLNPLEGGVFMEHQSEWVADDADVKVCEKGRRTGVTWAEAHDCTLIAAAARSAGGDNVFYIGDTKDKGLEFCGYVAHFAKFIEGNSVDIWEGETVVEYVDDDERVIERIASFTVRFKSGFRVSALASRAPVIRGLQGVVVIDEAAYHANVKSVLEACLALLIWGGRIRIISTHNTVMNAFYELIKDIMAGVFPFSHHHITFDDAVRNGLYIRYCMRNGIKPTDEGKEAWYTKIRSSYGNRVEAMREELDVIPREGEDTMLPMAWIEACMKQDYKVVRWEAPEPGFLDWPEDAREAHMKLWLLENVDPLFELIEPGRSTAIGGDFALRVDKSSYSVGYEARNLALHVAFILEMSVCPYAQQKQALFYIGKRLQKMRMRQIILDANGNGMPLAQEARQKFGKERVIELTASDAWYKEWSPQFREAFEQRMIFMPADTDTKGDLKLIQRSPTGVYKVPSNIRNEGTNGGKRHADNAVSIMNCYVAIKADIAPIEFESTGEQRETMNAFQEDGDSSYRDRISSTGFGSVSGGFDMSGF